MSECALASTSRRRIFSAPVMASCATCSRSCCLADCTSCWICALAAATRRSPSVLACSFDSSTRSCAAFSAAATISWARARASLRSFSVCFCASASDERPRSASARPSAIVLVRASTLERKSGQANLTVNQMNRAKTIACTTIVKLRFICGVPLGSCDGRLAERRGERVRESEEHREADADDERGVDQAEQQEDLGLELGHELRLARRAFEEAAAHDAHAHARAERAEADHQADADAGVSLDHRQQLEFCVHLLLSFPIGSAVLSKRLVTFVRHLYVDDGQHHEDVGLQQHDQDVEDRPAPAQEDRDEAAD